VDLEVAGALELLVDDVVHARAGVDQGRGEDRQAAALLDVARGAEETLRALQRVGVHAAGQHLAGRRHDGVVGARQAGDGIEQDDHVLLVLDQALGLLDHHLGDLHVARGGLVEGRGNHLAAHRALHLGHFLGPLVDQQHHQDALGMVGAMLCAMFCSSMVLPAFGGETIRPRWPLPIGATRSMMRAVRSSRAAVALLQAQALVREQRRQVLEQDLVRARSRATRS
jgi:hypothetical protein